jgi:hypothetical protein
MVVLDSNQQPGVSYRYDVFGNLMKKIARGVRHRHDSLVNVKDR